MRRCSRCDCIREMGDLKTCDRCRARPRYEKTPEGRAQRRRYYWQNREKILERDRLARLAAGPTKRERDALLDLEEQDRIREG